MRGRRPAIGGDESELADTPGASDTAGEALEALGTGSTMRLIARLPQDQAEAVVLRVVVGLDAKSAAEVLGKRAGAVRTAAHRGLRRLAELLGEQPDSGRDGPRDSGQDGGKDGADQQEGASSGPPAAGRRRGGGTVSGVPVQGRRRRDGVAESYVPGVTETAARTQKDM